MKTTKATRNMPLTEQQRSDIESGRKTYTAVRFRIWQAASRGMSLAELDAADRRESAGWRELGHS